MTEVAPAELVRRVAADEAVADLPLDEPTWIAVLGTARRERLEGPMALALAEDRLVATESQAAELHDALGEQMSVVVALEALALDVVALLDAVGARACLLKGLATAHLDHAQPWARFFADIDLLVRPEDLDAAYAALAGAGYERQFVEPVPGFDRRFGKGTAFTGPGGREVDLHRTLTMGALGLSVDVDQLWDDLDRVDLAGRPIPALGPERRFLHACLHVAASIHRPKMASVRDVMVLGRRPDLDLDVVAALAERWRYAAVVRRALEVTAASLSDAAVAPVAPLAQRCRPSRWDRVVLRAYTDARVGYPGRALVGVPAIAGWRGRVDYVRALARPDVAYRTQRGRRVGTSRWRRAAGDVVDIVRPRSLR